MEVEVTAEGFEEGEEHLEVEVEVISTVRCKSQEHAKHFSRNAFRLHHRLTLNKAGLAIEEVEAAVEEGWEVVAHREEVGVEVAEGQEVAEGVALGQKVDRRR